jgi:hypothetical protein
MGPRVRGDDTRECRNSAHRPRTASLRWPRLPHKAHDLTVYISNSPAHASASSRRVSRPSFAKRRPRKWRGRREGRVSTDTHGPRAAKSTRQNHRISQITGLPCAMVVVAYTRSPRGPAFLPPFATMRVPRIAQTSAPGGQDHTISPSATARSSAKSKLRCVLPRPSHPTPRVVTIAMRPSCRGGTCGNLQLICPTTQAPAPATDWHDGQFVHDPHAKTAVGH